MVKSTLSLNLDVDVVEWLCSKRNRSEVANFILKGYIRQESQHDQAWIQKEKKRLHDEFAKLKHLELEIEAGK